MDSHSARATRSPQRLIATALLVTGITVLALTFGHARGSPVYATGDGQFVGDLAVVIADQDLPCTVRGSLKGGSTEIAGAEAYQVTDTLVDTFVQCEGLGERAVTGSVFGRVTEKAPNGNGVPDGIADGEFDLFVDLAESSVGPVHTNAKEPIKLYCEEINLDANPTSYTCELDLGRLGREFDRPTGVDAPRSDVTLYGSEPKLTVIGMSIRFTGVPTSGEGPDVVLPPSGVPPQDAGSSGLAGALVLALAAAGAVLFIGAGALVVRRP